MRSLIAGAGTVKKASAQSAKVDAGFAKRIPAKLIRCFAERPGLVEFARGLRHIGALMPEIVRYRAAQIGVGDVVRGIGGLRQIAACDLVLALGAGLDGLQAAPDRKIDGLIVADLEMQKRVMFDRAPVAAEQRIGADEIDGAGDPAAVAPGHHQQHVLGHALADARGEATSEVTPAPSPRACLHVEGEEAVPRAFGAAAAVERVDRDAAGQGIAPFAPDRLAVARIEGGEKILETAVTLVVPVKLLVVTLH